MTPKVYLWIPLLIPLIIGCGGSKQKGAKEIPEAPPIVGPAPEPTPNPEVPVNPPETPPAPSLTLKYYMDKDGDGYGDPAVSVDTTETTPSAGYVTDNTDCNDMDKGIHPGSIKNENEDAHDDVNCDGVYYWLQKTTTYHEKVGTMLGKDIYRDIVTETTWDATARRLVTITKEVVPVSNIASSSSTFSPKIRRSEANIFDDKGNQLTYENHDGPLDSQVTYSQKSTYDDKGNLLTYERHDGPLDSQVTYSQKSTYDDKGNLLTYERHDGPLDSRVTVSKKYTYDDKGNLLTYETHDGPLDLLPYYKEENVLPLTIPLNLDW